MPSYSRELTVLGLLGAALWLPDCTQLTKIDWGSIPPAGGGTNGGSSGSSGIAGAAGESTPAGEGGMGGEAGASAGAGGESGDGEVGDTGGGGASAGNGGFGGTLGSTGGTAGSSGAPVVVHETCTTAPTPPSSPPDLTNALVLFDGGAGGNGNRHGRKGLDDACNQAKLQLALPQTNTEAVISLSLMDQIVDMPERYKIPRLAPHVVSPLGIEFASSWDGMWGKGTTNSLVCAGVMPPSVQTWLTGTSNDNKGGPDPLKPLYGTYEYAADLAGNSYSHACNEWSFAENDPDVVARVGSTTAIHDGGEDGYPYFVRLPILVSCDAANDHILCIAFNPVP